MLRAGYGRTPICMSRSLWIACCAGHKRVVQVMLKAKAAVDGQEILSLCKFYPTPLMAASAHGHMTIVSTLLDHGATFRFGVQVTRNADAPWSLPLTTFVTKVQIPKETTMAEEEAAMAKVVSEKFICPSFANNPHVNMQMESAEEVLGQKLRPNATKEEVAEAMANRWRVKEAGLDILMNRTNRPTTLPPAAAEAPKKPTRRAGKGKKSVGFA